MAVIIRLSKARELLIIIINERTDITMKTRNKMIALMMGIVLTLSMASTSMAATTTTTAQATKTQAATVNTKSESKTDRSSETKSEEKEVYGKIKKIDKDTLEIETAVTDTKDDSKTSAKDTSKAAAKDTSKTEDEKNIKMTLDGKSTSVTVEKTTKFLKEAEKTSATDTKKTDTKTADKKKTGTKTAATKAEDSKTTTAKTTDETIKQTDLKVGDIVKITMDDGKKVSEVKVLTTAQVEEKKTDNKDTNKTKNAEDTAKTAGTKLNK